MQPLLRRREPRALALGFHAGSALYVVVDLREVRASGAEPATVVSLRRLVLRERPSVIIAGRRHARRVDAAVRGRVPIVSPPLRPLPFPAVRDAYPEAVLFAPTPGLKRLARVAVNALIRSTIPPRTYATHRPRTPVRTRRSS